jgi:peptide/nickel transport system permease protein
MKKIFTGDLVSYQNQRNVVDQIEKGIPVTFSLCIGAGIIWFLLGVVFGYLSAIRAGRATDRALTILALVGISLPVFWLGEMLLYYVANKAGLFPVGDYVKFTEDPLQWANHLILHGPRQGSAGAPGPAEARAAELADPDHHAVRARLRRRDRRRRDPHRDGLQPAGCGPLRAVTMFGAFFIVLLNTIVDIVYAYLDPRIRLGTQAA